MNPANDLSFCPVLAEMVSSRRAVGRNGRVYEGLGALSTTNNLTCLRQLIAALKPAHTLEIGLSFGGSCLAFTSGHRDLGRAGSRQHTALDPYQSTVWEDCGLMAVERAALSGYLDFRPAYSSVELPKLIGEGRRYDLVYVNGSHLFEDVFVDVYYASRLLSEGGVMAIDDGANGHVAKVLRFVRANLSQQLPEFALSPYRGDGGRSLRYRVARWLGKTQLNAFRKVGAIDRTWDSPFRPF